MIFSVAENIHSMLSQSPILLQYGDNLSPIIVTKRDDKIDMQWVFPANHKTHGFKLDLIVVTVVRSKREFDRLENEITTVLKKAVVAEIRGDLRNAHQLRKKAHCLQIGKMPAVFFGVKDDSPQINKIEFDLLIGLREELDVLKMKLMELSQTVNHDRCQKLVKERNDKYFKFYCILRGVIRKILPKKIYYEPLDKFFRLIDPKLMGCDGCFDPLNIVPHEWNVPAKILNLLHLQMLQCHWLFDLLRARDLPSQDIGDSTLLKDAPKLVFDISTNQWSLFSKKSFLESQGLKVFRTSSRKRSREDDSS